MTDPLPPVAEDVLTRAQAYVDDETASEDPQALVAGLLAVIDLLPACEFIETSGTTHWCRLAADDPRLGVLEQDNEGLSRHVAFMERYRWRAARLEAATNRLLDALDPLIVTDPEGDSGPGLVRLDEATSALRKLLDDQAPWEHLYVSTACLHATHQPDLTDDQRQQLHTRCRESCKWCAATCACGCGHPNPDGPTAFCPDCSTELTPTLLMGCAPCDMKYSPPCEHPQCPLGDSETSSP